MGLDGAGNAYIAGLTHAKDFPTTTGALQLANNASDQGTGFVSKFAIPQGGKLLVHDFGLSSNLSSAAIPRGQSASATITLTPMNGFYELVSFSCSGLPNGASCDFSPISIVPGTTTSTTTLTLTTSGLTSNKEDRILPGTILALAGLVGLLGLQKRARATCVIAVALFLGVLVLNGCGGGGSSGGGGGPKPTTFTATIVGTSQTTTHTTSFTVTVN